MAMTRLQQTLQTWGTPGFEQALKREIEALDAAELPLQQALAHSSHVTDAPFHAMLIDAREASGVLRVKAGIFYSGIISGCSCADDPTPITEQTEYCVLQFDIDRTTGEARIVLLDD